MWCLLTLAAGNTAMAAQRGMSRSAVYRQVNVLAQLGRKLFFDPRLSSIIAFLQTLNDGYLDDKRQPKVSPLGRRPALRESRRAILAWQKIW